MPISDCSSDVCSSDLSAVSTSLSMALPVRCLPSTSLRTIATRAPTFSREVPLTPLKIKNKSRRSRARAAGRKLVVRGMFLIRHEQVSVVRFAVQHARDARPANALFARDRYFNAVRGKDLDHRFVWWYEASLAGAGELDFEALVLGARDRKSTRLNSSH